MRRKPAEAKARTVDLPAEEPLAVELRATKATVKVLEEFLARPTEERYGYRLLQQVGVQTGTGYPILLRLEKIGVLASRWEETNEAGPRRRLYRLTAEGEPAARQLVARHRAKKGFGGIPRHSPAGGEA